MTKRNVNVDLARVVATILVIVLHVLGQGGILKNASPDGVIYWVAWFLEILSYCAVNCFALISGYVMVNKNAKLKSLIALWFQVIFYSLLMTALMFVLAPETRNMDNLLWAIFPVLRKYWWYISAYFGLFILIPVLNAAVNSISQATFKKILICILIGVGVGHTIMARDTFTLYNGHSVVWLAVMYLFGAYIKKYNVNEKTTALRCFIGFFAMVLITFLSKFVFHFATKAIFGEAKLEDIFVSYTSVTIMFSAIFLFLFCLKLKINRASEIAINFFAPATLGVYLIHVHDLVYVLILKDAFVSFIDMSVVLMLAYITITVVVIFLICSAIDLLRIQFFKFVRVNRISEFLGEKITRIYVMIFENEKTKESE